MQTKPSYLERAAIVFCAVYLLVAPVTIGVLTANAALATIVATCGAFVCLLVKVDNLLELSLGPVKARMREQIQEATATVQQLRAMSTIYAKAQLTQLAASNFLSDGNRLQQLELHDEILAGLKKIGVDAAGLTEAEGPWRKGVGIIYHRWVRHFLKDAREHKYAIDHKAAGEAADEIQAMLDFAHWDAPSPERIREVLNRYNVMTVELDVWLNEYRHFLDTGEIKRREVFAER